MKVFLAARITREEIEEVFGDSIQEKNETLWSVEREAVIARRIRTLGSLVLSDGAAQPGGPEARTAMVEGIRRMGLGSLPWTKETRSLQHRSEWLRRNGLGTHPWPDLSDASLLATAESWLTPFLEELRQRHHLQTVNLKAALDAVKQPAKA